MAKNSTVFVRPNLKGFFFGAILLLLVQHLISSGASQGPGSGGAMIISARELSDGDIRELIRHASERPSADIYTLISNAYERRGDYRKALLFLRRAEKISQMQERDE